MASILQLAGMLPRDPQFRAFVSQYMVPPREPTVDEAAAFIRAACEIESRRELVEDREAETRFHRFIRKPFTAWREKQHQPLRRAA
jgi:hypothetical protein